MRYTTLHDKIRRIKKKPALCEFCNFTPSLDLANLSGNYLDVAEDWVYLCRKCHVNYDRKRKLSEWIILKERRERNRKWRKENKNIVNRHSQKWRDKQKLNK